MEIRSSHQPAQRVTASQEGSTARFKPGQQLEARVLEHPAGASPSQNIRVQTPAGVLELHTPLQVKAGQILHLKVIATEPKLELELIRQQSPTTPASHRTAQVEEALRQFVPRQQGLQYMSALLAGGLEHKSLPVEIRTALQQILAAIPSAGELRDAGKLAAAIRDSGLFLESSLAAGRRIADSDLKLLWLSLLAQVRSAAARTGNPPQPLAESLKDTPLPFLLSPLALPRVRAARAGIKNNALDQLILRLFGMAEASVSRISLNQIATAETQQQGEARWKLEIPLAFPNDEFGVMQFLIEREAPDSDTGTDRSEQEHGWTLSLALDMPGLGPVHARLRLRGQTLETWIRAEDIATVERLNAHLPQLRDRLTAQGLDIKHLDCREGRPENAASATQLNMLNIKV